MHVKEEKTTTECVYNLGSKKELYPRNQLKKAPNNAGPPPSSPIILSPNSAPWPLHPHLSPVLAPDLLA